MKRVVLDASVFVSALIPREASHARSMALLDDYRLGRFVVPSLFEVEVVAALARRGSRATVVAGARAALSSGQFEVWSVDACAAAASEIAQTALLRAYDAVYVAVALDAGLPLATLDLEVRKRVEACYPQVELVG